MAQWGCAVPHNGAGDGLGDGTAVILDFGQPGYENGSYGAYAYDQYSTFHSLSDIKAGANAFIGGYMNSDCGGSSSLVTFIIGTNNCDFGCFQSPTGTTCQLGSGGYVNANHGAAWANMVRDIGQGYGSQVRLAGGIDAEPCWSHASEARAWVDGFWGAHVGTDVPNSNYIDFGTCDNCPYASNSGCYYDSATHPNCDAEIVDAQLAGTDWKVSDVYYVSWKAKDDGWASVGAPPVPEIYSSGNADQWEYIMLYGAATNNQDTPAGYLIQGTLTQCTANNQKSGPHPPPRIR